MKYRECLRTSTNVWRSLCDPGDHFAIIANWWRMAFVIPFAIHSPYIRHTFATGNIRNTTKTTANAYEQLRMSGDHLRSLRIHGEWAYECNSPWIRLSVSPAWVTKYEWIVHFVVKAPNLAHMYMTPKKVNLAIVPSQISPVGAVAAI